MVTKERGKKDDRQKESKKEKEERKRERKREEDMLLWLGLWPTEIEGQKFESPISIVAITTYANPQ